MRDHVRVVVKGRGRRADGPWLARALWTVGELAVTVGVVVLLLVVHQVWWTNRQAEAAAREEVRALERGWDRSAGDEGSPSVEEASPTAGPPSPVSPSAESPSTESPSAGPSPVAPSRSASPGPGVPWPGEGAPGGGPARETSYAVLRIPRLGVVVPVAQGVDKRTVLDKGYVGHYPGTAQPGERGNFALAGHRNTHGEPFRYINRLSAGDEVQVDVRGRRYTYVVGRILPETTERDTGVVAPVPRSVVKPEFGYSEPGSYITLTTCTPEYTSKYRLVVWGTLRQTAP